FHRAEPPLLSPFPRLHAAGPAPACRRPPRRRRASTPPVSCLQGSPRVHPVGRASPHRPHPRVPQGLHRSGAARARLLHPGSSTPLEHAYRRLAALDPQTCASACGGGLRSAAPIRAAPSPTTLSCSSFLVVSSPNMALYLLAQVLSHGGSTSGMDLVDIPNMEVEGKMQCVVKNVSILYCFCHCGCMNRPACSVSRKQRNR
ncbi:unnamed protein product, partial [Urochloa humidicola]